MKMYSYFDIILNYTFNIKFKIQKFTIYIAFIAGLNGSTYPKQPCRKPDFMQKKV